MQKAVRVGHYAAANTSRPWLTTQLPVGRTKSTAKTKTVEIVNPIFHEWSEATSDTFWKAIFTSAAIGKFRRGWTFSGFTLTYKIRNKIETLTINSTAESMQACIDFFRARGIRSSEDTQVSPQNTVRLDKLTWSEVKKKKKMLNLLISTYIADVSRKYNLTHNESMHASSVIKSGFIMGTIQDAHIIYSGGRINDITGILQWDPVTRKFSLAVAGKKSSSRASTKSKNKTPVKKDVDLMDGWMKFLDIIERRHQLYLNPVAVPVSVPATPQETPRSEPSTPRDPFVS